jgi:hypothetical protein
MQSSTSTILFSWCSYNFNNNGNNMNFKKFVIFLAVFTSTSANASSVTCPDTVKAGTQLTITIKITNKDCFAPMLIKSRVLSLMGTSASGGIGLQGPFVKPFANGLIRSIPQAKCTKTSVTPTSLTLTNQVVVTQVPVGMAGKLVAASAGVLDTDNKLTIAGVCNITVTN